MRDWKQYVRGRLRLPQLTPLREAELVEDVAEQLEEVHGDAVRSGMSEEDAQRAAEQHIPDWSAFGADLLAAEHRHRKPVDIRMEERVELESKRWGWSNMFSEIVQDAIYGLRAWKKSPGFTALAVLAFALGIGANAAIFTVCYSLIWRPLPGVEKPEQLVSITLSEGEFPSRLSLVSYQDYKSLTDIFSDSIAYTETLAQFNTPGGTAERIPAGIVSGNYFSMLGVRPVKGRAFEGEELDRMGAGNVVLIDYEFWQRRFGGSDSAIGAKVQINAQPFTVIGVLPADFRGTFGFFRPDAYAPMTGIDALSAGASKDLNTRTRTGYFAVISRLRDGVNLAQARTAAATQATRLGEQFPEFHKNQNALVYPEPRARMETSAITYMPPIVTVFMTLTGLVLLVACANVANLLLARATGRQKEIAIRSALGAHRWRIARQLLTETLMISLAGAAAGLLLARWGVEAISSFPFETDLPIVWNFSMDYRILAFTAALAVLSGVLAGLLPGLRVSRTDLANTLKAGGRTGQSHARQPMRDLLVVVQMAVSMVLLVAAGLFFQTARNAARAPLGFELENRLVMAMDTDLRRYDTERSREFYRQLLERVQNLPGVNSAAYGRYLPIGFSNSSVGVLIESQVQEKDRKLPDAALNVVGPEYFKTMGMPILQGRAFTVNDKEGAPLVAVINDTMATKFWPGQFPIGRRFQIGEEKDKTYEIVGVTRTVKFVLPAERPTPGFYVPMAQRHRSDQVLHIYAAGDPAGLVSAVRSELMALDPDMPVWDVRTLEAHALRGKMRLLDLGTAIVSAFGGIGVILAAVGLYGVMSFVVGQRTQEFGVRMALGATQEKVLRMILWQALRKAILGAVLGCVAAFGVTRLMTNFLVGVSPTDVLTFSAVTAFLLSVAAASALAPAWRATRVDPLAALWYE